MPQTLEHYPMPRPRPDGLRIHAATTDRGGCFWFRIQQPLDALGRLFGHDTSYGDGAPPEVLNEADVLIGKFLTGTREVSTWLQIARAPRRPLLVYDVDDSYYHVEDIHMGSRSVYSNPLYLARAEQVITAADLVTCSTPAVAELYSKLNKNCIVLPNAVPTWLPEQPERGAPAHFTIGYQCSPSHQDDMQYWAASFYRFLRRHPDARIHFIGPDDPQGFPKFQTVSTPWVNDPIDFHLGLNGAMTVGIAPLKPNLTFNLYKSGIKAQTYQALGIPAIVSDATYYRDTVVNGRTGFIVKSHGAWYQALEHFYEHPESWALMGAAGRELERSRSMDKIAHLYDTAYRKAISG